MGANWAELLEAAVAEGLCNGWSVQWWSDGSGYGFGLYTSGGCALHYNDHCVDLAAAVQSALANLRRARRPAVEYMDADALEAEALAAGWKWAMNYMGHPHSIYPLLRARDEPITHYLRRVVAHIRQQEVA